jgi:MraZ protein
VAQRGLYQGHGIGLVDDKGRVAIPAPLRATLALNAPRPDGKDGGTIVIGVHSRNDCLIAYDPAYLDIMAADLDMREKESLRDGRYDDNIKREAAAGEAVPFDGSGRFIMPEFPRYHAEIETQAFFYGRLDYIEIWNPQTLLDTPDLPKVMYNMANFWLSKKGGK